MMTFDSVLSFTEHLKTLAGLVSAALTAVQQVGDNRDDLKELRTTLSLAAKVIAARTAGSNSPFVDAKELEALKHDLQDIARDANKLARRTMAAKYFFATWDVGRIARLNTRIASTLARLTMSLHHENARKLSDNSEKLSNLMLTMHDASSGSLRSWPDRVTNLQHDIEDSLVRILPNDTQRSVKSAQLSWAPTQRDAPSRGNPSPSSKIAAARAASAALSRAIDAFTTKPTIETLLPVVQALSALAEHCAAATLHAEAFAVDQKLLELLELLAAQHVALNPPLAACLANLSDGCLRRNDAHRALQVAERAVAIFAQLGRGCDREHAIAAYNLTLACLEIVPPQTRRALEATATVLNLVKAAPGDDLERAALYARCFGLQARCHVALGNTDAAWSCVLRLQKLSSHGEDLHAEYAVALERYATLAGAAGDATQAVDCAARSVKHWHAIIATSSATHAASANAVECFLDMAGKFGKSLGAHVETLAHAAAIYAHLARREPERFELQLAVVLYETYEARRKRAPCAAQDALRDAINVRRTRLARPGRWSSAEQRPQQAYLASYLFVLSSSFGPGNPHALDSVTEAAQLRRALYHSDANEFAYPFQQALLRLGQCLEAAGRVDDAHAVDAERKAMGVVAKPLPRC